MQIHSVSLYNQLLPLHLSIFHLVYLCVVVHRIYIVYIPIIFGWSEHSPRESPLHLAVRFGLCRLAELLLCQPGGLMAINLPNEDGVTPMQLAQTAGNLELLELLTQ